MEHLPFHVKYQERWTSSRNFYLQIADYKYRHLWYQEERPAAKPLWCSTGTTTAPSVAPWRATFRGAAPRGRWRRQQPRRVHRVVSMAFAKRALANAGREFLSEVKGCKRRGNCVSWIIMMYQSKCFEMTQNKMMRFRIKLVFLSFI